MPLIADYLFDLSLTELDTATLTLYVCSAEPTTVAEADTTFKLGTKAGISVGAPANGAVSGRRVTVAAITNGTVNSSGNATHYAIVDTVNNRLLVTNALAAAQALVAGNTFSLAAFDVTYPDAVSE